MSISGEFTRVPNISAVAADWLDEFSGRQYNPSMLSSIDWEKHWPLLDPVTNKVIGVASDSSVEDYILVDVDEETGELRHHRGACEAAVRLEDAIAAGLVSE